MAPKQADQALSELKMENFEPAAQPRAPRETH